MTVHYNTVAVDGLQVFYRSAPVVLLMHGFPSAGHMFRDLTPEVAGKYHVVAPDLPGFGMIEQPARDAFADTFENIAKVFRGVHGATVKTFEARYAHVWTVPNGKIITFRQYIDTLAIAQARV